MQPPMFITGLTINQTVGRAITSIMRMGKEIETRNGTAKFLNDITLEIQNPRERHLSLTGRKSNIFQLMAESFWVMAGQDQVTGFLEFYLPRATDYSDDGAHWHGAYGPRIYDHGQMDDLIETFRSEGKNTRRAILMIANPMQDNLTTIQRLYGEGHKPKDIPCNREIHFYVTDNKLNCKVIQRSGDMIFGTGSINPFEFTFLQEIIYQRLLKLQGFEDLELGVYRWHVTNAHIYSNYYLQAEDVMKHFDDDKEHVEGTLPVAYPFTKEMFAHKLSSLNEIIACDNVEHLRALVNHYPFGKFNEIIELYYVLIKAYTLGKKIKELLPDQKLVLNISSIPDSLAAAIEGSAFKNFDINYDTESVSFHLVETK
ncbi:thymidylate synthase [Acinetobacter phage nACB2]|nr:thymidylate synthase [Acinetobacter phage nACB2]